MARKKTISKAAAPPPADTDVDTDPDTEENPAIPELPSNGDCPACGLGMAVGAFTSCPACNAAL